MERRLFGIMTLGGTLAALFGVSMIVAAPGYLAFGWLHVKLALVALLIGYHVWCYRLMVALREGKNATPSAGSGSSTRPPPCSSSPS
jgi:putative membrane protein